MTIGGNLGSTILFSMICGGGVGGLSVITLMMSWCGWMTVKRSIISGNGDGSLWTICLTCPATGTCTISWNLCGTLIRSCTWTGKVIGAGFPTAIDAAAHEAGNEATWNRRFAAKRTSDVAYEFTEHMIVEVVSKVKKLT